MRWLEDEINDLSETKPYREGGNYYCRNCGTNLGHNRRPLCRSCQRQRSRPNNDVLDFLDERGETNEPC